MGFDQRMFDDIVQKVKKLEDENNKLKIDLNKVKGSPIIQGYSSKRIELNDNLNVIELKKGISDSIATIQKNIEDDSASEEAALKAHTDLTATAHGGIVPDTRKVNGHSLSSDVTLTTSDFDLSEYLKHCVSCGIPSSPNYTGVLNRVSFDSFYLYVCVGSNSWKRIPWDSSWTIGTILLDESGNNLLDESGDSLTQE